jgi:hypothetical protein
MKRARRRVYVDVPAEAIVAFADWEYAAHHNRTHRHVPEPEVYTRLPLATQNLIHHLFRGISFGLPSEADLGAFWEVHREVFIAAHKKYRMGKPWGVRFDKEMRS